MGLIINELVQITAPSYFKIVLTDIKDTSGNLIDMESTGISLLFVDNYANKYICVYDPINPENTKNSVYNSEEGTLTLIFQDYKLRDRLKVKICSFVVDEDFEGDIWKSFDSFEQVKITILWK